MAKVGVESLKAVVDLGLALVEAGVEVAADGKLTVTDLKAVVGVLPVLPPALVAIPAVPAQVVDLDAEEAAEIVAHVMAKLAVDDAKARAVVAASLKVGVKALELGLSVSELVKAAKA